MVHPDGVITGCSSVFAAQRPALAGGRMPADSLDQALGRLAADPLIAWIQHAGPVALKQLVERRSALRLPEEAVNICHLCGDMLGRPDVLAVIRQALPAPARSWTPPRHPW